MKNKWEREEKIWEVFREREENLLRAQARSRMFPIAWIMLMWWWYTMDVLNGVTSWWWRENNFGLMMWMMVREIFIPRWHHLNLVRVQNRGKQINFIADEKWYWHPYENSCTIQTVCKWLIWWWWWWYLVSW